MSLAHGSHAPDSASEDFGSGDEDSGDESTPVGVLYSSTAQRLSGALDVLLEVAPALFSDAVDPSHASEVSGIEEVLGCASNTLALQELGESKVVTSALRVAFKNAATVGASSSDRAAPPRFLPLVKPWLHSARCLRFKRVMLPEGPLIASEAEKDLVRAKGKGTPPAVLLTDKILSSWEGHLLGSLKNLSLTDSLLSGVGKVLVAPSDSGIPGTSCAQGVGGDKQEELFLMLSSLGQCVSSLASGIATSYTNGVLARREAVLVKSSIPPHMRSSLRVLPLSDSLFGPQVSEMVHQASGRARDSAFLRPLEPRPPSQRGHRQGVARNAVLAVAAAVPPRVKGQAV